MKTVRGLAYLFVFILPIVASAQQRSTITGTLLGSDNAPMVTSHVRLAGGGGFSEFQRSFDDPEFAVVQVDSDGSFVIATDSVGALTLTFTGVGHTMLRVPLILEHPTNLTLHVQLEPLNLAEDFRDAEIIYDLDKAKYGKTGYMTKRRSKVYDIELPADKKEFKYRIREIGGNPWGVSIPNSSGDAYEYFREGIYTTIVYPASGIVKITLDDTQPRLPRIPSTLSFADTQTVQSRFFSYYQRFQKEKGKYENTLQDYMRKGGKNASFSYNWAPFREQIKADLLGVHDTIVKDELAIEYLETAILSKKDRDADYCRQQISTVSPESFAWVYHRTAALQAKTFHPLRGEYVQRIISTHPTPSFRANLIFHLCAYAKHERKEPEYQRLYSALVNEYGKTPAGEMAILELRQHNKSTVGTSMPSFSFTSLDSGSSIYTNKDFMGKFVLVDFWATWCGPCVAEMKYLHNAYARFHQYGFEILSVSFDASSRHAEHFRSTRWKMPWPNAYVESNRQTEVGRAFDVRFPKPMLIGPTGTILEIDDALRGQKLENTLSQYLSVK